MKKNLMGKVTTLHFLLPASFLHARDETLELLRDDAADSGHKDPQTNALYFPSPQSRAGCAIPIGAAGRLDTEKRHNFLMLLRKRKKLTSENLLRIHSKFYIHQPPYRNDFKCKTWAHSFLGIPVTRSPLSRAREEAIPLKQSPALRMLFHAPC